MHEETINLYIEGKYGKLGVDRYVIYYSSLKYNSALGTLCLFFYMKIHNLVVSHVKLETFNSVALVRFFKKSIVSSFFFPCVT